MKNHLRLLTLILLLAAWKLSAQPANDDCTGAFNVVVSDFEENVVLTSGDTRGATASTVPTDVCSNLWSTDDIFFKFRTASVIPLEGLIIKAYFDKSQPTDVPAVGMALYESCDSIQSPLLCFNSNDPADNHFEISGFCLESNHTYFIRVWSMDGDSSTEGTLRIGVYINRPKERILWWETFDGGIENNGWITYGTCSILDSSHNAFFSYLPDGIIDNGAYAVPGQAIHGVSFCDGAVGVDSDFNDNIGSPHIFGSGPCPTPGQKFLISPVIYSGDWNVRGLTLTWIQSLRQYQSDFFISYRFRNESDTWTNWIEREVNREFEINSALFEDNLQHYFLPGASGHDSIQIRFLYNDNYYFWAIDDVKLVETKCNDGAIVPGKSAFVPFANIPADQVYPFVAGINIFNAGACQMKGTKLSLKIQDILTKALIYDEELIYDPIDPDFYADYKFFPKPVDLPRHPADYLATYLLTFDSLDIFPDDNIVSYNFSVGGNVLSLENGKPGKFFTNASPYGLPASYTFGNYFRPASNAKLDYVTWGVANPSDLTGEKVNINLIQWTDNNNDQIAQSSERNIIGHHTYTFSGLEMDTILINTIIQNENQTGAPIILEADKGYMVMIEYNSSTVYSPNLNLLASDLVDYTQLQLTMDAAFTLGHVSDRTYFSVYGFSFDGNISNIDYEVREINPDDTRIFPGNDVIPVVRITVSSPDTVSTKSELSSDNQITIYPNPSSDEIHVKMQFKKPQQYGQLRLLNNLGQMVFSKTITTTFSDYVVLINVTALTIGNYMLQVETPDGQRSLPVIVAR